MPFASLNARTVNSGTLDGPGVSFPLTTDPLIICLGEFNAAPVNTYAVNECEFYASLGVQNVANITQLVGNPVSGTVVTLTQSQQLQIAVSGLVVTCSQAVKATIAAYTAATITQFVDAPASFLSVHGWDTTVSINGAEIAKSNIAGDIVITKESNQNTLCEFKVKTTTPLAFIAAIDGGAVVINYFDSSGGHRVFTGTVDLPEVDLINKWITIKCSDRREELIKAKMLTLLPTLGRYSKAVQGEITSVGNEMEYRLSTVPSDVDFDSYNTPNINSWYAKGTADYTYTNSDVYYQEPKITWQSRGSIVNDITVEVRYEYPRLYHYQRPFSWTTTSPAAQLILGQRKEEYSFPTVGMIKSAIDGANWKENDSLTYTESLSNYWAVYTMLPNSQGGQTRTPLIHHVQGEENYEVTIASWDGSTRFAQTIEEVYTLNVKSTQSINQYTALTAFNNYKVKAEYGTDKWEAYKTYAAAESGAVVSNSSYYVDKDINIDEKNQAILTAIDKAKTQIIASHRDTVVSLQVPIKPDLELRHTLQVTTTPITCKGKVTKIRHIIRINERKGHSTDIEVALFRSQSSATTTATTVPAKPVDVVSIPSSTVVLGNHLGYDYDALPSSATALWNGFVGNILGGFTPDGTEVTINNPGGYYQYQTNYAERFIVDTPSAPDELRNTREVAATATYETALPNDSLDIVF